MPASRLSRSRVCSSVGGGGDSGGSDSPLYLSGAMWRSPEIEDPNAPAEIEEGVLNAKLYGRRLALLEAPAILFPRALLISRSLSEWVHFAGHSCELLQL